MAGEALLIIDMQAGMLAEVPDADALTVRLAGLADRARAVGRPVFVIQHQAADLVPGEPEWRLAEAIAPRDGDVLLAKRNADSFIGTDLDERLRDLDISHVIVTGLATEWCSAGLTTLTATLESPPRPTSHSAERHQFCPTENRYTSRWL
jgi:nicotinamidase-related amidase